MSEWLKVGRVRLPVERAANFVDDYTAWGPDPRRKSPYAFPAYDHLDTGTGPAELNDGDLLAPVLLNVGISIRAMYGLQHVRGGLEEALANEALTGRLVDASDADIADAVEPVYRVVDGPEKPLDVGVTKLSKLVHRKRPEFLVLHDKWVRACYFGADADAPVPLDRRRSWSGYMVALHRAMRDDLRLNADALADVRRHVPAAADLTDVRLMDVLAWSCRGRPAS